MVRLQPGDPAPAFELPDQHGRMVRLSDFAGRKLLLFFYPKAGTSGCTTQAVSVRDALDQLAARGAVAVGISPDAPDLQLQFDGKHGLGYPLLADTDHRVAEAYGVWGEKKLYGKTYLGIIRSSMLIDEAGRVLQAWYKISPKDTVAKALAALG